MSTFYVGDIWKPEDTITDPKTKAKVDPTTVTAQATAPSGATSAPSVSKLEVGVYICSISLTEAGKWKVVFTGTGTYQGAKPETITVYPP